ncbi:DUF6083 domain-containing protein [Actinacidiphila glaucinigra]|uniref:DUF6083 domain-containing protein n=1 Tax=Actinacidiphila glaucinigra TaxID=235986 RepID=UPI002DDB503F|nr:DUF6083 domain-containing protein [Actinacidiphila glaucinigra]WSD57503.1 DUF6083 domain-containing protein [Actinacidiphila glaucinigra]WSD65142.1 DUF6083 domain-containing protein [Actinacidiphila glaucinigra]
MRSTNNSFADDGCAWDGSRKNYQPRRALRIDADSPSRLLRSAQVGRCDVCGNRVEWYQRPGSTPVPLHPEELPASTVPAGERWHVSSGAAHAGQDGSAWCRVRHHAVCPAGPAGNRSPLLAEMRRALGLTSRRLQDAGLFTPRPEMESAPAPPSLPVRPVVCLLYTRYLAPGPLEHLQCVAHTRSRRRCPLPVQDPGALPGMWRLEPADPLLGPGGGRLPLTQELMAVYDLTGLPYAEQLRWHKQRCSTHAGIGEAADHARTEWEPFDPVRHRPYVRDRLPDP